jgi:hypothetical protein
VIFLVFLNHWILFRISTTSSSLGKRETFSLLLFICLFVILLSIVSVALSVALIVALSVALIVALSSALSVALSVFDIAITLEQC